MNEATDRKTPSFTTPEIIGSIVITLLVIVFGQLFMWQIDRMYERRTANDGILARLDAPPVPSVAGLTDTTGTLYRRIQVRGVYDNARSIVLPGRSLMGTPGVHLLTPVIMAGGDAVLINRGWVPSPDGATVDMSQLVAADSDSLVGLVLPFPDRSQSVSSQADSVQLPGEFRRVWYAIDERSLRAQFPYSLAPFHVQLLPVAGGPVIPRPLVPPVIDEGPHLSYALQWFSFAVICIVGWMTYLLRSRAARRGGSRFVHGPPHPPRI